MPFVRINGKACEVRITPFTETITKYAIYVIEQGNDYGTSFVDDDLTRVWNSKEEAEKK